MPPPFVDDLTARIRGTRFGREVLGPRVAAPLAAWLQNNFVEPDPEPDAVDVDLEPERDAVDVDLDPERDAVDVHLEPEPDAVDVDVNVEPEPFGAAAVARQHSLAATHPPAIATATRTGKGNTAEVAATPTPAGLVAWVRELARLIKGDNLVIVAAGIAFWGLLAIPAVLFATISIAGLVLDPSTVREQVDANLTGLPAEARQIIGDQLAGVSGTSTGGLVAGLIFGIVLALWTSSGAMAKLMAALNTIYGAVETRKFLKLRGQALLLTFGGIVFIAGAIFLLAVLPPLLSELDAVGDSLATLFVWLRFLVLGVAMIVGLGVLYHFGPDRPNRYQALTTGGIVATVSWIALSALFSIYTATVGSYNETYGSIGGIVVLLLWLFITAFVVLIGAEIHARRERVSQN